MRSPFLEQGTSLSRFREESSEGLGLGPTLVFILPGSLDLTTSFSHHLPPTRLARACLPNILCLGRDAVLGQECGERGLEWGRVCRHRLLHLIWNTLLRVA